MSDRSGRRGQYRFDGRWVVRLQMPLRGDNSVATGPGVRTYTVRCTVSWWPSIKRYRVVYLQTIPGAPAFVNVARAHIRRWLTDHQARPAA